MRWLRLVPWICGAVHASAAPRLTLAEMAEASDYIVEATVLRSWTTWDEPHRFIWTHYELSVTEWLKAPVASDRTIVVSEPGGTADGLTMLDIDATPYLAGEKVVVLARRTPEGFLRAAGNGQGKFTITHHRRMRWSPHVIDMLRDARDPDERLDGMPLDDFKIYVRRFEGERRTAE